MKNVSVKASKSNKPSEAKRHILFIFEENSDEKRVCEGHQFIAKVLFFSIWLQHLAKS